MSDYATISVPSEVKKILKEAKGRREWGEFLLTLYGEAKTLTAKRAFEDLAGLLTEKDLESMLESSRKLRERFAFREKP